MESIIFKYLREKLNKKDLLSVYMNMPAVFNKNVPDDMDENWGETQFPRCVFDLSMQSDSERKISGQLLVDVMCENEIPGVQPEELESLVRSAIDGCFFSKTDLTISAKWKSSDAFSESDDKVSGITLAFDILAYPVQETEPPDPVHAVNLWLKTLYQNAKVIGRDTLPAVWKPTDESPALYCRLSNLSESPRMKSTAAVTWIGATMRVNVMAPSEKVRSVISKSSIQILTNATRLMLNDGSPMLIDNVTGNMAADPMREGQIQIKSTYGVLNEYIGTPLNNIYVTGKGSVETVIPQHHGSTDEDALIDNELKLLTDNDGICLLSN